MKKLQGTSYLSFHSQKSLLWAHGGHPSLPSSAELYEKQIQLSKLCELDWPRKMKFWKLGMLLLIYLPYSEEQLVFRCYAGFFFFSTLLHFLLVSVLPRMFSIATSDPDEMPIYAALSCNSELRFLAVQGRIVIFF